MIMDNKMFSLMIEKKFWLKCLYVLLIFRIKCGGESKFIEIS